jgi:hypothetical protein
MTDHCVWCDGQIFRPGSATRKDHEDGLYHRVCARASDELSDLRRRLDRLDRLEGVNQKQPSEAFIQEAIASGSVENREEFLREFARKNTTISCDDSRYDAKMMATHVADRLKAVEAVLEQFVGCKVNQLHVRSIDLLRQQPVDLDKLMTALGGEWAAKVKEILALEAERKVELAKYDATIGRQTEAAPLLGYRDKNGNKITEEQARQLAKAGGGE